MKKSAAIFAELTAEFINRKNHDEVGNCDLLHKNYRNKKDHSFFSLLCAATYFGNK
jgi:hypothetical protein